MTLGPNFKLGTLLFLFVFIIGAVGLYGGATLVDRPNPVSATDGAAPTIPEGPVNLTVVAKDLKFNTRQIGARTGARVTITLDNQDAGTLHNVAFYTSRSATQTIFKGELFPGPMQKIEAFDAPATPGSYYFRCDAHPDTMNGTFTVQ